MEEIKAMAQEKWKMSILYPRTSKRCYHHIKFWKRIMNSDVSTKKTILKNFVRKHLWVCKFIKKTLQYSCFLDSNCEIFKSSYFEEHLWMGASDFWEFFLLCQFEPFPTRTNNIMNYLRKWRSRSSHRRCSVRKGFLRNFAKFTGKHLCQSLFFNKVAGLSLQLY